jgi:hypothetical protein
MGLLDLLINSDESSNAKTSTPAPVKQPSVSFSDAQVGQTQAPAFMFNSEQAQIPTPTYQVPVQVSNEYMQKAFEMYEKGFESLNKDGFDFYEYYQSVMQGGPTNPQVYTMAFGMGSIMDKSLSKSKLIQDADFYVAEITKVYNDNVTKGNAKKQTLLVQKDSENKSLVSELENMEQQLEALKVQIDDRKRKLSDIDNKYSPDLTDFDNRLGANELAKNRIINSIEQVKQGINLNIK